MTTESNIIDFEKRLRRRAAATKIEDLQDLVREHYTEAFKTLAERHEMSDAWAAEKAAIAIEIVSAVVRPMPYEINFSVPENLSDAEQAAIRQAVEEWAKEFGSGIVKRCLETYGGHLLQLAIPEPE